MTPVLLAGVVAGSATAAVTGAASGNHSAEIVAAALGGLAAVISAVTGLIVALRNREQVIVVSPEEAERMGLPVPARRRRRRRSS